MRESVAVRLSFEEEGLSRRVRISVFRLSRVALFLGREEAGGREEEALGGGGGGGGASERGVLFFSCLFPLGEGTSLSSLLAIFPPVRGAEAFLFLCAHTHRLFHPPLTDIV